MTTIDEARLLKIVAQKIAEAENHYGTAATLDRGRAMKFYLGEPFGNEVEGRSQVVSRDVAEAVDGMMPSLMRLFASGSSVVRFEPRTPQDEPLAQQATDFVNWLWSSQNPGFANFYEWFKDALLYRLGVLKIWWDAQPEVTTATYRGLTDAELATLLGQEGVEPIAHSAAPDPNPPGGQPLARLHEVTVRVTRSPGRIRIETVPPEDFLVTAAPSLDKAEMIAHRIAADGG